jgi:hypothetical protein
MEPTLLTENSSRYLPHSMMLTMTPTGISNKSTFRDIRISCQDSSSSMEYRRPSFAALLGVSTSSVSTLTTAATQYYPLQSSKISSWHTSRLRRVRSRLTTSIRISSPQSVSPSTPSRNSKMVITGSTISSAGIRLSSLQMRSITQKLLVQRASKF